ncbi:MAG: hypothetical protein OXH92_16235 [Bryobacterales bacterium]|nr:hypothetical protein [Bryobacterales bacterium]
MTAESDGKGRRGGQPDLLASLPAEHPPSSRPEPGIDPAAIEELLAGVRDLRERLAGLSEAVSAERPAPVPEALTGEALQAWGEDLVTRVGEAARTAAKPPAAPKDDAAAAHMRRIEEAAAKAAGAAERIGGGLDSTADRVATEVGEAVTRIETGLMKTRDHVDRVSRLAHGALQDIETRVSGRFSKWTIVAGVIVFALGMMLESRALIIYRWLW